MTRERIAEPEHKKATPIPEGFREKKGATGAIIIVGEHIAKMWEAVHLLQKYLAIARSRPLVRSSAHMGPRVHPGTHRSLRADVGISCSVRTENGSRIPTATLGIAGQFVVWVWRGMVSLRREILCYQDGDVVHQRAETETATFESEFDDVRQTVQKRAGANAADSGHRSNSGTRLTASVGQMRFRASHECLSSARIPRFQGFAADLMPPRQPLADRCVRADAFWSPRWC